MQQLAALLRLMELRGISKAHCLAGSGISEEFLEQPHLRPTRPQYEAVLGNIIARSPPGVGLAAGLMASVQDYGVLGHACLASGTMREVNHLHRLSAA